MRIGHLIRRTFQIAQALFIDETSSLDLTPVQYAALKAIIMTPGIDQASLSRFISFDKTTLVKVLHRLVEKGLITRVRSTADRRRHLLSATELGVSLEQAIAPMVDRSQARLLAPLDAQEQAMLIALLRRLIEGYAARQDPRGTRRSNPDAIPA